MTFSERSRDADSPGSDESPSAPPQEPERDAADMQEGSLERPPASLVDHDDLVDDEFLGDEFLGDMEAGDMDEGLVFAEVDEFDDSAMDDVLVIAPSELPVPATAADGDLVEICDTHGLVEVEFEDFEEPHSADSGFEEFLKLRIAELEDELASAQERTLRLAADHENFKRRADREREEIRRYGSEKLLVDMLPVLDNFERALAHATASGETSSLLQGVQMVQRQFVNVMVRYGCEAIDSVGQPFDPQRHEAVQQVESAEHPGNTVVEEYHRGYFLYGRLLRPAMVVVTTTPRLPASKDVSEDSEPIAVDISGEAHIVDSPTDPTEPTQ